MFVDEPRDAKQTHLLFLRWLLEQEKIEGPISDQPLSDEPVESIARLLERPVTNRLCVPRWFGR